MLCESRFLAGEFSNLSLSLAKRLIGASSAAFRCVPSADSAFAAAAAELGGDFREDTLVKELSKKQIHQITRLLREAKFPPPTAKVRGGRIVRRLC
jgi:hypothetical protein